MANEKPAPIKPMPFPGESPTVALAMAAGQKYGLHDEAEKPAERPKRRATTKKQAATKEPARKAATRKPARKTSAKKPARRGAKRK